MAEIIEAIDMALSVYGIATTLFGIAVPEEKSRLETLAENTQADVIFIKGILQFRDFSESQQDISIAMDDFANQIDGNAPWSEWEKWAGATLASLDGEDNGADNGALSILHQIIKTDNKEKNIIDIFKNNVQNSLVSEKQTVSRLLTNFMFEVQSWQAIGYHLVFQANRIKYGPQGNNWDYRKMVQRISAQSKYMSSVLKSIDDSESYLVSSWKRNYKDQLNHEDANFAHLGEVLVDEGHVVIGFKLYHYGNRLAIKLKQGVLNEIGVITQAQEEWKYPVDSIKSDDKAGVHYTKIFDNSYDDRSYLDLSFVKAEKGSTIVGVKFCMRGNRMGICIKTKKVDFSTGTLSGGKWSDAPWSDGNTNTVNYWTLGNGGAYWSEEYRTNYDITPGQTRYIDAVEVVSDPPAMLTGVGMKTKVDFRLLPNYSQNPFPTWYFGAQLQLKARDIFEFVEDRTMNCDGKYPYFGVETDDKTSFSCCNGYLYNKTAQICLKDEEDQIFKPYFIDCGDTPVPEKDQLECANGKFADIIDGDENGCLKKNSYRFRCPYPKIPCQDMRVVDGKETLDFHCDNDCSSYGGKRKTCNGGKMSLSHHNIQKFPGSRMYIQVVWYQRDEGMRL